jgi:hypothetical protein
MAQTKLDPLRVKISPELVAELSERWSVPVQVRTEGKDRDGDLVLIFRTTPRPAADA